MKKKQLKTLGSIIYMYCAWMYAWIKSTEQLFRFFYVLLLTLLFTCFALQNTHMTRSSRWNEKWQSITQNRCYFFYYLFLQFVFLLCFLKLNSEQCNACGAVFMFLKLFKKWPKITIQTINAEQFWTKKSPSTLSNHRNVLWKTATKPTTFVHVQLLSKVYFRR